MSRSTLLYHQLLSLLSQYSKYRDFRHLKALAWMINALICSSKINLSEWESYVISRANQAQSIERRWQRFVHNNRIKVKSLYIPLVMAAISNGCKQRLYLALDTTVLWNRYCMIHLSVICGGRVIPFLWKVMEHKSSTVAFKEYKTVLKLSHRLLGKYADVMLLADRGFANHQLIDWLATSQWHYCLRLPCGVTIHGARRHPIELKYLCPPKSEAILYHNVGLWLDGRCRSNFVLANVKGAKEPWAVITDEDPTLQALWQYALRFRIEELFLDSKSGAFQLEESKIRDRKALERLYLVVALALLFATTHGMTIQLKGLRTQVDPHWERGLSYLKIGLRWLKGVLHKGRSLFDPTPLFSQNTLPCFASSKARRKYYDAICFTRISELKCLKV
ncbi:MAG: transposase [Cyanobacteria bacterium P01_G01_bin.19]